MTHRLGVAAWSLLGIYLAILAFLPTLSVHPFIAGVISIVAFGLAHVFLPNTRPQFHHLITPINWALFAFFMLLVMFPLVIGWVGPATGVLSRLPSVAAINWAILIDTLAYLAFCCAYQVAYDRWKPQVRSRAQLSRGALYGLVVAFFVLGLIGVQLKFGGVAGFIAYLTNPISILGAGPSDATSLGDAASTFLRPFLIVGIILLWCLWIDARGRDSSFFSRGILSGAAILGVLLAGLTFNFNRSAFAVPLLAMAGVYSQRLRRISIASIGLAAPAGLMAILILGTFRASGLQVSDIVNASGVRGAVFQATNVGDEVQVYGGSPQFLGFLLESTNWGEDLHFGKTLVSSVLYPVPIVGKSFRATSGVTIYNALIYGNSGVVDQILPFLGELFMNFHLFGVVLGFGLLGIATALLQRRFENASTAFDAYIALYTAIWVTFLIQGGLSAFAQIVVYFYWPIYAYWLLTWARRMRSEYRVVERANGSAFSALPLVKE